MVLFTLSSTGFSQETSYSLRFFGNGVDDIDRVKIPIDNPAKPADVGATDFTIEFWMNASLSENSAAAINCGENYDWIYGNIIFDRDRFSQYRGFGISIAGGHIVFGIIGDGSGWPEAWTLCSVTNVLDGNWHHITVQRRRSDGWMWLFIDGGLERQADGPKGDISYPDGVVTNYPNDPFVVIGAEKHDAGPEYPSYSGWIDELRISNLLRYVNNFTPDTIPLVTDQNTVALYHFDEGSGDVINDVSGASGGPSDGIIRFGGSPAGPEWSTSTPFNGSNPDQNLAPVAQNDFANAIEDISIDIDVLNNDSDPNGDKLLVADFKKPMRGNNVLLPDQKIRYTSESNYFGSDSFLYSVGDNRGGTDSAKVVILVTAVNDTPAIISTPDTLAMQGVLYHYQTIANDPDVNDTLSYFLLTVLPFLKMNSSNGLVTGTPRIADVGNHAVSIGVSDSDGASDTQDFILRVLDYNDPPIISKLPALTFMEDDTFIYSIESWFPYVNDLNNPDEDLDYSVISGDNVQAVKSSNKFLFYPSSDWFGEDTLVLIVDDGILSDSKDFLVQVTPVNDPPQILANFPSDIVFSSDSAFVFDLDTCVNDIDNIFEELLWSVMDANSVSVYINQVTHICSLYYNDNNVIMSDTIHFVVTDPGLLSDTTAEVIVGVRYTDINGFESENPDYFYLTQNYPNPFNSSTTITFSIPSKDHVTLEVLNIQGQRVGILLDQEKSAGRYTITFRADGLPSGIYYYRLITTHVNLVRKMLFIK